MKNISYEKNEEPIVLSKYTMDRLLKEKNYSELLSLYSFYYYTAKWQATNQPKATNNYVAKGIGWSERKVIKYKQRLIDLGFIEPITRKDDKNKIVGWYIRVKFIWSEPSKKEKSQTDEKPQCGKSDNVENVQTNALNTNSLNALNTNSLNIAGKPAGNQINLVLNEFKEINPHLKFNNTTERKATQELIDKHGFEGTIKIIKLYKEKMNDKYCPVATKPTAFVRKMGDIAVYFSKLKEEENNQPKTIIL